MEKLTTELERLKQYFDELESVREGAYASARELRRTSVKLVRDVQRGKDVDIESTLKECREMAIPLGKMENRFGFVEEALQEYAEAALLHAFLTGSPAPTADELGCTERTFLLGMADGVSELRRRILTLLRANDLDGATKMFDLMDELYYMMLIFDHTEAVLPLRRKQDALRAVVERTRADITSILCQKRLEDKLSSLNEPV